MLSARGSSSRDLDRCPELSAYFKRLRDCALICNRIQRFCHHVTVLRRKIILPEFSGRGRSHPAQFHPALVIPPPLRPFVPPIQPLSQSLPDEISCAFPGTSCPICAKRLR